jgi:GntR family transcriptional regulator
MWNNLISSRFWNKKEKKLKKPTQINHPYRRLQSELEVIISNTKPGERLLTEPLLSKQLGVSRSTLREAMRTFEAQGRIRRQQGIGTFVVDKRQVIDAGLEKLESIESIARRINLPVSMGWLVVENIFADKTLSELFLIEKEQPLVKLTRIIHVEKRPVAYLIDVLLEGLLSPEDLKLGFTGSVLDLLLKSDQAQPNKSYTEIQAVAAQADIARAMQIQRGDVLLHFNARLYSKSTQIVDISDSYFLPGYFRFHVVRTVGV